MFKNRKVILIVVFALLAGWWGARVTAPTSPLEIENEEIITTDSTPHPDSIKLRTLQKKLQALEEIDLAEYHDLKDKKEQYLKANEILGKVMLILLADMGMRLNQKKWQPVAEAAPPIEITDTPREVTKKKVARVEEKPVRYDANKNWPSKFKKPFEEKEKTAEIMNKKGRLKDPTGFFRESAPFREVNPLFQKLKGNFWGDMIYINEEKVEIVELQTDYQHNGKEYEGDAVIIIYNQDQVPRSRSRSNGKNNSFQSNSNDPNGIVIETSPNSFIHLRFDQRRKRFSGFYYAIPGGKKEYKLMAKIPKLVRR